jgi:hypothetical protein
MHIMYVSMCNFLNSIDGAHCLNYKLETYYCPSVIHESYYVYKISPLNETVLVHVCRVRYIIVLNKGSFTGRNLLIEYLCTITG